MAGDVCGAIASLRSTPATAHVAIIAFAPDNAQKLIQEAQKAGANVAVGETAVVNYLDQIVNQALEVQ
jgi:hypothetical protein